MQKVQVPAEYRPIWHTCRFPLILDHFRHQLADATRSGEPAPDTIVRIQTRSAAMVEEALSGDATHLHEAMAFISSPNADCSYTGALACDYVRLSHDAGSFGGGDHPIAVKQPSFLSVDTVLHETGHGLHLALWSKSAAAARGGKALLTRGLRGHFCNELYRQSLLNPDRQRWMPSSYGFDG